jgi:hypothetical protein
VPVGQNRLQALLLRHKGQNMSQLTAYRSIGVLITVALLTAAGCEVEVSSGGASDDDGGASAGGAEASGGVTGVGGKLTGGTPGVGGAAGSASTISGAGNASAAGNTSDAGSTGSGGTAGSAGATSVGTAGAAGAACLDTDAATVTPNPICQGITAACGSAVSSAYLACATAWGNYKGAVALAIEQCLGAMSDPCAAGSAPVIEACTTGIVGNSCATVESTAYCEVAGFACATLHKPACGSRVAAAASVDAVAFGTCMGATTTADCDARLEGCL